VAVCAETGAELMVKVKQAEQFADLIEVRFDCLKKDELAAHLASPTNCGTKNANFACSRPVISTFRPKDQGGHRDISFEERSDFWNAGHATEYRDVEQEFPDETLSGTWGTRITSFHDFEGMPDDLEEIFHRFASQNSPVIKIAAAAADASDAIDVWKMFDHARQYPENLRPEVIPIAMGEAGKWTRILGLAHGAFLTYASLDSGGETAPGQITAKDMAEVYRVKSLDKDTKVYGVIGDPVSGSLSPYIHNPAFVSAGVNAVFIPLKVKDLDQFMRRMVMPDTREVELGFAGFAVTMPHKQAVMKYLDAIDDIAAKIGAVNTIKIEDGRYIGYNTDAYGFITPLRRKIGDIADLRVAVFGAGGAARACIYALKKENAAVTIFARDPKKAKLVADDLGVEFSAIENFSPHEFDVVVNATPLGMNREDENKKILTAGELKGVRLVFDLITGLADTPFISEAKKAGVPVIGGLEMLLAQGAIQFEIWTGIDAPLDEMRNGAVDRIKRRS